MKDLNYQLSKLCRDNRDGGFSTQATRSRILDLAANELKLPKGKKCKRRFRKAKVQF